uniref:KIB1-4 beta-propeller domain-containing protein n=1 Tax=Oryza meridionalis TaxID=40149 RepID=A0A0E0D211_9ORYZ
MEVAKCLQAAVARTHADRVRGGGEDGGVAKTCTAARTAARTAPRCARMRTGAGGSGEDGGMHGAAARTAARTRPQARGLDLPPPRALVLLNAPPHPRHRRCRASSRLVPPRAVASPVVVARGGPGVAFSFDGLCDLVLLKAVVVDISDGSATVAVLYRREREFAVARTGERSWRLVNNKLDRIVDMARHGDGKLYTVHLSGKVFNCNVHRSPKILESVLVIDSPYHYVVKADGNGNAIIMSREYEHDHRNRASECCYLAGAPRGTLYLLKRVYKHKQVVGGGASSPVRAPSPRVLPPSRRLLAPRPTALCVPPSSPPLTLVKWDN